jgi:hypothetical protein
VPILLRCPIILLAVPLVAASACSDSEPPPGETATISVLVTDSSHGQPPVPGQEVHVSPGGLLGTTDDSGLAVFHVPAGDYLVSARLCCGGPALLEYDEEVTLPSGGEVELTFHTCLTCQ